MNDHDQHAPWIAANQHLLVLEFQRLVMVLAGNAAELTSCDHALADARAALPAPAAIDVLSATFTLSPFERALVLLCAGIEMDARVANACQGIAGRPGATFAVALAALEGAHWSALTPGRPLRRWRLVEPEVTSVLTSAPLRLDERILHYLAGINQLDVRLQAVIERRVSPIMAEAHRRLATSLAAAWRQRPEAWTAHQLVGDDPTGAEDVAALMAAQVGLTLLVVPGEQLPTTPAELETFAVLWEREAALLPAALLVQVGEAGASASVSQLVERISAPLMIVTREPLRLRRPTRSSDVRKPEPIEQQQLWHLALGDTASALNGAVESVANQFRLSAQAITDAGSAVQARISTGEHPAEALWSTCRTGGRRRLDDLAHRIPPGATWNDLILPAPQLAVLHQIVAQVRQRGRVLHEWGFGRAQTRGLGVSALFSGESGTGKTLSAEVLASELHLDLYRIDLSSVVNKYIGETEKNLRRLFDAAEDSGAILLFDEADALFGKRSEVKDSHDRYANLEVSYLLQRMEAYSGLAILTTNLKSSLDPAFQRRLRFIVHFPFPDAEQRTALWQRSFPAATPTTGLDHQKLARLHIAGGAIRNIALNAAFLAADAGTPVTMTHLLQAAQAERSKLDRPLSETETRGWL